MFGSFGRRSTAYNDTTAKEPIRRRPFIEVCIASVFYHFGTAIRGTVRYAGNSILRLRGLPTSGELFTHSRKMLVHNEHNQNPNYLYPEYSFTADEQLRSVPYFQRLPELTLCVGSIGPALCFF